MPPCLLWDFGDTLCDERFIWSSSPEWMAIYEAFEAHGGMAWCEGALTADAFAQRISEPLGMTPGDVARHMRERCHAITWMPQAWTAFRARTRPQAIVTVNPDLFSEVIVPAHALDQYANVIVTSWEERTNNKADLCDIALERLSGSWSREQALLIDNKVESVEAWRARGGRGYIFTTDGAFARDWAGQPFG